jgi:hypothetical protein
MVLIDARTGLIHAGFELALIIIERLVAGQ